MSYIYICYFSLVFQMVEAEEEYTEQMEILVSCFVRPFKMAASSKKPPCSHEDVNSIFLNSETVLFLHQIFLKGLTSRMESWPTLVLGTCYSKFKWWQTYIERSRLLFRNNLAKINLFCSKFTILAKGFTLLFCFEDFSSLFQKETNCNLCQQLRIYNWFLLLSTGF